MNSDLVKSLNSLIDETLQELEDLKKSRFSASEIKLDGPGADGIAGKPTNGHLGKDEDKKEEDEEDEDEDDMDKGEDSADDMDKKDDDEDEDDMDKAEGKNASADPGATHHGEGKDKGAGPREQTGGGKSRPASGTNSKADMGEIHKDEDAKKAKKGHEKDEDEEDEEDEKTEWKMKKSQNEMTSLMKSFVDERIKPLEDKLSTIADLVNKVLDQPVAPRGFTARSAVPLSKSAEEFSETLSKSQVSSKLWELKKSGTPVDSLDVTKAEMGQELDSIVKKYKIS